MKKKITILVSSMRSKSNSEMLAEAFRRGAEESGHTVEWIPLKGKEIRYCSGCMVCNTTNVCTIQDDAPEIVRKIQQAQVVVFATPIYFYEMAGQMKTMLDRTTPIFSAEYEFRDVYLLAAAADTDVHAIEGAEKGLQGWIDCFEKASLAGTVFAGGVTAPGEIEGHEAIQRAYQIGKAIQ